MVKSEQELALLRSGLLELVLVLIAALSPMYFLASSIGEDELLKSGIGITCAAAVHKVYSVWSKKQIALEEEE